MKKLLILFFGLFCVSSVSAQEYRPLSEFGTDTIAYMRYNFVDRKAQYINQPLSKILADYELELTFNPTETHPYKTTETVRIYGAVIVYPNENSNRPFGMLEIDFKTPHLPWQETFDSMEDSDDDWEWVDKLQDCTVKEIELAVGPFGPN